MNEIELIRAQHARERAHLAEAAHACARLIEALHRPDGARILEGCGGVCEAYFAWTLPRVLDRCEAQIARLRQCAPDIARSGELEAVESALEDARRASAAAESARPGWSADPARAEVFLAACARAAEALAGGSGPAPRLETLAQKHFALSDWRRTALVDADGILEERARYDRLQDALRTLT